MNKLHLSICALLISTTVQPVFSQDIRSAELGATPLQLNPANTGSFNGDIRASSMYANHLESVTVPYVTYGSSVDMPVYTNRKGNKLAAGLQLMNDKGGDGALQNFHGMLSAAYQLHFVSKKDSSNDHRSALSFGVQGGYNNRSIDMDKLYFRQSGTTPYRPSGIGTSVIYYTVNAGISFSHESSSRLNYTIGCSGNNLIQPADAINRTLNQTMGLGFQFIGTVGANWSATRRLSISPKAFLQTGSGGANSITGSEFSYVVSKGQSNRDGGPSVFTGIWYYSNNIILYTVGMTFKGFRFGVGLSYDISPLPTNGGSVYEFSLGCIGKRYKRGLKAHND